MCELSNIFIDRKKMDLVLDLINLRPNLHTIILDINVLTCAPEFLADWLFKLNRLTLKFLNAQKLEDIRDAFNAMDSNEDGTISIQELNHFCASESGAVEFWMHKYGKEYKVKNIVPRIFLKIV